MMGIKVRARLALLSGSMALTWGAIGIIAQTRNYDYDAVESEHRITGLEGKVQQALDQLNEIREKQSNSQYTNYFEMVMMGGLSLEAGGRLYKKINGPNNNKEE